MAGPAAEGLAVWRERQAVKRDALQRMEEARKRNDGVEFKSAQAEFVENRPDKNLPPQQYLAVSQTHLRGKREIPAGEKTIQFHNGQYATDSAEEARFLAAQPGVTVEDMRVEQGRKSRYFAVPALPWKGD